MKMKFVAAVVAAIVACGSARADDAKSLAEIVAGSKDHTILLKAVTEAGLVDVLKGDGELTVFAPTDAAFKKLGEDTIKKVLADKELLKSILTAHVVKGKVLAADVVKLDGKEVETLQGTKFKVEVKERTVMFGGAKVTATDLKAKNGVVHVIDTVLMPAK